MAALTETETVAGVVPEFGVTESQLVEEVVVAPAVNEIAWPVLLPMLMVWAGGVAPPRVWAKVSCEGLAVGAPAVTWRVTGMMSGLSRMALLLWVVPVIFTVPE